MVTPVGWLFGSCELILMSRYAIQSMVLLIATYRESRE
jgi:hypothetical protein